MNTIKLKSKKVKMIAHRGASGLERENTCPAFVAAGNRSYFGIETDVHLSKDGKFVIFHDENTKRVTLGEVDINIEENDYSKYKDLVLPDVDKSTNRQDIRIPLLIDYISICKKYEKVCVLELKNPFTKEDVVRLTKEIKDLGYLDKTIFISFSFQNCVYLREILSDAKIQWLTSKHLTEEDISNLVKHKLDLDVEYRQITKKDVKRLHKLGLEVNVWTCDDKVKAKQLVKMGVDYITSNILE